MSLERFISLIQPHIPVTAPDDVPCIHPQSVDDLVTVVQLAGKMNIPIQPWGSLPLPGTRPGVGVDLGALNAVRRHRVEEGLVRVETGITMGELTQAVKKLQQYLALRYPTQRTLFSVLAEETISVSQTRYEPLRHQVVGVEVVTGDGIAIHHGAEVVKNVTGYDMNKLFIGSQHQFGLITEVILRLIPQHETIHACLLHVDTLTDALELLTFSRSRPSIETASLFKLKTTFGWQVLLILSGVNTLVQTDWEALKPYLTPLHTDLQVWDLSEPMLDQWLTRLDWLDSQAPEAVVVRVALPQQALEAWLSQSIHDEMLDTADVFATMGSNTVFLRWIQVNQPDWRALTTLKTTIQNWGGEVCLMRLPMDADPQLAGLNRPNQSVLVLWQERLKAAYDPHGILPKEAWLHPVQETPR